MIIRSSVLLAIPLALTLTACTTDGEGEQQLAAASEVDPSIYGNPRENLSPEQLEAGRLDRGWQRFVQLDSATDTTHAESNEAWEDISAESLSSAPTVLPVRGDGAGPTVARVQIALDQALFSPGIVDGRWGKNTEKAVYWLQKREGLPATGEVDSTTFDRIVQLAGVRGFTRQHSLTADDVSGPFVDIPDDIYDQAELDCMCYESLREKLAERFHTSAELLERLNPGINLDAVQAGASLTVPNVREAGEESIGTVARIVISDGGHYLHALDASDRILAHFPTTLGSDYAPSPDGEFTITAIAHDPTWYYQPDLLTGVDDSEEPAVIPPGPNNAVGVVWMALSKEHYGIHGTRAPETIGYTTSHGCVRLTNWDAHFLSHQIEPGVDVDFRDVT